MQPFSITLFATSGDPEGIRHFDKSNWGATAIVPIPRPENSEVNMQSSRYALPEKLLAAKNLDEVWA